MPLSPGRVTPADGVDLETPARRVLHEAAAGREVHDVVLVDLRGDHHDGGLPHHRRRGRVLQQLEDLVAKDDRPGRGGQVLSHLEHAGWHGPWHTVVVHDVLREVAQPADDARAARLEGALTGVGIEQEEIGGGQGRGEVAHRAACPLLGAPVQVGVVDQAEEGVDPCQIGPAQAAEEWVLFPGPVLEPPVPRRRPDPGATDGDPGPLQTELPAPPGDARHGGVRRDRLERLEQSKLVERAHVVTRPCLQRI